METKPGTTKETSGAGKGCLIVLAAGVILGGSAWGWNALTSGPPATYHATITGQAVINPATLSVAFRVTNTGEGTGDPSCTINASDPSGAYTGVDQGTLNGLKPGGVVNTAMVVTITGEGAGYVTHVTVTCT